MEKASLCDTKGRYIVTIFNYRAFFFFLKPLVWTYSSEFQQYTFFHNTVAKPSPQYNSTQPLQYSATPLRYQSYSITSGWKWDASSFIRSQPSGGTSSKAFWPGLLPWGHCHPPGDTSNTWKKNLQSCTPFPPSQESTFIIIAEWQVFPVKLCEKKLAGTATDSFVSLCSTFMAL